MLSKRLSAIILLLVIFSVPLYILAGNLAQIPDVLIPSGEKGNPGSLAMRTEQFLSRNFPYKETLKNLAIDTKLLSGQKESNGIYIAKNHLMENVVPPAKNFTAKNTQEILRFIEKNQVPTYFMLVPTACAIKRQELPQFAAPYNQKTYIDDVYAQMLGKASSIDVYSTLFANKEKYIYYRTQSDLTALGGYYVYSVLGRRLDLVTRTLEQYDIEYIDYDFYGDLYQKSPYREIEPDLFSLYHFSKYRREYKIVHEYQDEVKSYYTLYPLHLISSANPLDIYLGGISPVTHITIASSYTEKLLIFADESVLSYLPFLVNHYAQVTVVDLAQTTPAMLEKIELDAYQQILFSYSTDNFMQADETMGLTGIL